MSKTHENLQAAFAGESQANRRYLAFAQRAADEYKEGIYKLFRAIAEGETIHALKHLQHMKAVKSTEENLKEAMSGEMHEFKSMYPQMIEEARQEGAKGAEVTLTHAMEVEKVHHQLLQEALEKLDDYPVQDYYICPACGYIAAQEAPERCPVCGALKSAFYKAMSQKEDGIPNL
ncbi:MAG: rubrerythrin family protein [Desulfobacterales bacterium]|jgi:rubrerythrin